MNESCNDNNDNGLVSATEPCQRKLLLPLFPSAGILLTVSKVPTGPPPVNFRVPSITVLFSHPFSHRGSAVPCCTLST